MRHNPDEAIPLFSIHDNTDFEDRFLVPNLTYRVIVHRQGDFRISVYASGSVSSNNPDALQAVGNTLTFNNTTIITDPGNYPTSYSVQGAGPKSSGGQTLVLVPDLSYRLAFGDFSDIFFFVDTSGNVISSNPDAVQGTGNTLTFQTATITIDPGDYTGLYYVNGPIGNATGVETFLIAQNATL